MVAMMSCAAAPWSSEMLVWIQLVPLLLSLLVFAALKARRMHETPLLEKRSRVAFVFAHPDDESMFFVPSILSLGRHHSLYLLCLCTGNSEGLGNIRRRELYEAAQILGIPSRNVHVINDDALQDGMDKQWQDEDIQSHTENFVHANEIDVIITFDDYGVSGHPNHIAVSRAVCSKPPCPIVYVLESPSLFRKYTGFIDAVVSVFAADELSKSHKLLISTSPSLCHRAMMAHASQFVWFRRLSVIFSRFTFVNTLQRIQN